MRENELEQRRLEAAKIIAVLNEQQAKLNEIFQSQRRNTDEINGLYELSTLDIEQLEGHRTYGIKLVVDQTNQERLINNTKKILEIKQKEVLEAHKKVEVLKKLKEKQKEEYYKEFLRAEAKELDDITSARFNIV